MIRPASTTALSAHIYATHPLEIGCFGKVTVDTTGEPEAYSNWLYYLL